MPLACLPRRLAIAALSLAIANPATATITAQFEGSAPRDIFTIRNEGACDLGEIVVTLDLSASASRLIFDTEAMGAGRNVHQPFEIARGAEWLIDLPVVADGATSLTLRFRQFPAGGALTFTIDIDDTIPQSQWGQTRVTGGEMAGAEIVAEGQRAPFGPDGTANLPLTVCLS